MLQPRQIGRRTERGEGERDIATISKIIWRLVIDPRGRKIKGVIRYEICAWVGHQQRRTRNGLTEEVA